MRRVIRILLIVGGSVIGLLAVLLIAALITVQTPWFRDYARQKLVAAADAATGGRVSVGSLSVSLIGLSARADNLVLRGTEAPVGPPLASARSVAVGVKFSSIRDRRLEISYLEILDPQVFVAIRQDGTTNLPHPKTSGSSSDPIQTVLNLAIGHVDVQNGLLQFADRKVPINIHGDNLRARIAYESEVPRYVGALSIAPVWVKQGERPRLPVNAHLEFTLARSGIDIRSLKLESPASHLRITAQVPNVSAMQGSAEVNGRLSLLELARTLGTSVNVDLSAAPPMDVAAAARLDGNRLILEGLQVRLGETQFAASGHLQDLENPVGSVRFDSQVSLSELGRIFRLPAHPEGRVNLGGDARLDGTANYAVQARFDAAGVAFGAGQARVTGLTANADVHADPTLIELAPLHVAALGGTLNGKALVLQRQQLVADIKFDHFELRELAQKYASRSVVYDGMLSGTAHASANLRGSLARQLLASARLVITPGSRGVPISGRIGADYDGPQGQISLDNSWVAMPHSKLTISGTIGRQLQVGLESHNLGDFLPAIALVSSNPPSALPVQLKNGVVSFNGTVSGQLSDPRVAGRIALANVRVQQRTFDRLTADFQAQKSGVVIQAAEIAQGQLQAALQASVGLRNWKPEPDQHLSADASVRSAPVKELLAAAGQQDTKLTGTLDASAKVWGTIGDPQATADAALTNGEAGGEPFERAGAHIMYSSQLLQVSSAEIVLPSGHVKADLTYQHAPKEYTQGQFQFRLRSTPIQLQNLKTVSSARPGAAGALSFSAQGAGTIQPPGRPRVLFSELNAKLSVEDVRLDNRGLGDLNASAQTSGQNLNFHFDSNLAGANIHGNGTTTLAGDFPLQARLTFGPVHLAQIRELARPPGEQPAKDFDGTLEGSVNVSGPAVHADQLRGELQLTQLEAHTSTPPGEAARPHQVSVRNNGPIVVALDNSVATIRNAHLSGEHSDISVEGSVRFKDPSPLALRIDSSVDLALLQALDPDLLSTGKITLAAKVNGPFFAPILDGRLQLINASVNTLTASSGISNANGVIQLTGQQAVIQNLTAESGGGKLSASGVVRYGGPVVDFQVMASAKSVRVRYPQDVTTRLDADLRLAGTTHRSLLSGKVTVREIAFHSHTDFASILSRGGQPPTTPSAKASPLGNMRLDVHIQTAPDVQYITPLTEDLQASANLRLRGLATGPGMLGRVVVTQGNVLFFGSKYDINRGNISFFDPTRIAPVLDVDLETMAKGVDIILSVSGPMNNLKLTYRSDPPMQFSDIVQLLATGNVPTTDPILAASQPAAPQQNVEQRGASALLGQAVANPVAGRLQRLFGVTQLKIDPQIIGAQNTPQARLTLEQQISRNLTFIYITDLTQSNPQVIQIEWAIDRTWSAIAQRDIYGQFGVDFYYKRNFK